MNGVLENLAQSIANTVAPNEPEVKILNAQAALEKLKIEEEKVFAEIGRKAFETDGEEKFAEFLPRLNAKREEIKNQEENLRIAKEEKEAAEKAAAEAESRAALNICSNCGTQNGAGVKFCMECGTKLEVAEAKKMFCTNCGAENKSGTKFCVNCGNKF